MATVRPKSSAVPPSDKNRKAEIKFIEFEQRWCDDNFEVLGLRMSEKQEVSIEEADIVVSGGRGLKKRDNFRLIEELAEDFGAQVGASRDAVDRGWASYPHQVGLSGKTISPRLYVACGISGAVQHLAGIKTAECIVAVNKDEHAHILDLADFALIGDLFSIIPEISRQLKRRKTHEA
jgi:electron transfer flavoprotein alpha subunit